MYVQTCRDNKSRKFDENSVIYVTNVFSLSEGSFCSVLKRKRMPSLGSAVMDSDIVVLCYGILTGTRI